MFPLFSLLLAASVAVTAHASALTTPIAANEKLCFYADVDKAGEKIGVRPPPTLVVNLLSRQSSSTLLCVLLGYVTHFDP
jgi:hypothetical protein